VGLVESAEENALMTREVSKGDAGPGRV